MQKGITVINGEIRTADGSTSQFQINESAWLQWGAGQERLGETAEVVEALESGLEERGIQWADEE